MPHLRVGQRIRLPSGQAAIVEMVNPCRARIRPERRRTVEIETAHGDTRRFLAPAGVTSISPESDVKVLGMLPRQELEAIMAKKKSKKTATKKTKGPKEQLCTFAIRITPAERDAIHKAGGPRGATAWARKTLAAASKKAS